MMSERSSLCSDFEPTQRGWGSREQGEVDEQKWSWLPDSSLRLIGDEVVGGTQNCFREGAAQGLCVARTGTLKKQLLFDVDM